MFCCQAYLQPAYQLVKPDGVVEPTCNYYFMIASTVIISAVASFVINRFMMKKYGQWDENTSIARRLWKLQRKHMGRSRRQWAEASGMP